MTIFKSGGTLIFMLLAAAVSGQNKGSGFVLKGHISGVEDSVKVYLKDIEAKRILDSAITLGGGFVLKGSVTHPSTCWLECKDEYAVLQVENTAMTFESPLQLMRLYGKATGGTEQALQNKLSQQQYPFDLLTFTAYDTLSRKLYYDTAHKRRLTQLLDASQDSSQAVYIAFGKAHPDSWLGMDILYRNRKSIGREVIEKLLPQLPVSAKARSLGEFVYGELAAKGKPMIDFSVADIHGKSFTLSSLKGKYILLSFWDAGCGPCRGENKKIAKEKQRFDGRLVFVSFSMDKNKAEWERASKQDQISWYNVSDGKGGTGKIKTLYDVQAMPAAFLINPDGVIVETFTGFSADFLEQLDKLTQG